MINVRSNWGCPQVRTRRRMKCSRNLWLLIQRWTFLRQRLIKLQLIRCIHLCQKLLFQFLLSKENMSVYSWIILNKHQFTSQLSRISLLHVEKPSSSRAHQLDEYRPSLLGRAHVSLDSRLKSSISANGGRKLDSCICGFAHGGLVDSLVCGAPRRLP